MARNLELFVSVLEKNIDNRGKTPPLSPSGYPLIEVKHIQEDRLYPVFEDTKYVDQETWDTWFRAHLKPGDILFSTVGSIARSCMVPEKPQFCIAQNVLGFRVNRAKADPRFLYYAINGSFFQHEVHGRTIETVQKSIKVHDLKTCRIPLPSLTEQKAIAAALGALDDKIELNRRMNTTLEAMARALFQSWFVDFDPVRVKLDDSRPTGIDEATTALFPEHLEESDIGNKPVGWEVTTLEMVLSVLETGGRPKGGVGGILGGIPSIGAESIVSIGRFDFGKTKFVPVEFYERMNKGHIESHDVLIYKDGGRPGEYEPHVSMFGDGFPFEKCCINEHVYRLRTNERLSQEYLYFWLTSDLVFAEMRIKGTGVAIPGLNSTAVRSLPVLVPPRSVVDAFTQQAAPLVTRLLANAKQSRTLATLRDALLPKLLSGEVVITQTQKHALE
jgi:type I restriction enzyme S subunit